MFAACGSTYDPVRPNRNCGRNRPGSAVPPAQGCGSRRMVGATPSHFNDRNQDHHRTAGAARGRRTGSENRRDASLPFWQRPTPQRPGMLLAPNPGSTGSSVSSIRRTTMLTPSAHLVLPSCYRMGLARRSNGVPFNANCLLINGLYGAQGRNRTTDTAIFSRMLYQLSYLGIRASRRRQAIPHATPPIKRTRLAAKPHRHRDHLERQEHCIVQSAIAPGRRPHIVGYRTDACLLPQACRK